MKEEEEEEEQEAEVEMVEEKGYCDEGNGQNRWSEKGSVVVVVVEHAGWAGFAWIGEIEWNLI